jgi:hypothetical protein
MGVPPSRIGDANSIGAGISSWYRQTPISLGLDSMTRLLRTSLIAS